MNTTEQKGRARRIKGLRAKAESTQYPAERDILNAKADELEKVNRESGYQNRDNGSSVDSLIRGMKIREWSEYVREYGERGSDCICGTDTQRILGFDCVEHPKRACRQRTQEQSESSTRARSSSSHTDCYVNGVHENTKAGRAACRRSRV